MNRILKKTMWIFSVLAIVVAMFSMVWLVFAAETVPGETPKMEWFTILGALINTAGVLAAVQGLKVWIPVLREKLPWILPILAGAIGPAVAVLQAWVGGILGVAIDISPVIAIFTGATATAANQVYKQAGKAAVLFLLVGTFAFSMSGCASMQTQVIDISQQGVVNAEASRVVAKNILSAWALNSGFLEESIGEDLPGKTLDAMALLDLIAAKCPKPDQCTATDKELGKTLAAWAKVWTKVVETAITKIMKFIPKVL